MEFTLNEEIAIPFYQVRLKGDLCVPKNAQAIVIFSHGSGSSRFSRRNQIVARQLQENGLGTLLFDLLTKEEDQHTYNRFNIDLLAQRLIGVTQYLHEYVRTKHLQIGYFGASTGAASALKAAATLPYIGAVVSRGGRPDLAASILHTVEAPTLLIVGSLDKEVLALNKSALEFLTCPKELAIVDGASHLFEEPGTMKQVADLATSWFEKHLASVTV